MVDNEIDEPEPDMINFVTQDGIVETAVKERVDFLCDINDNVDGQDYFKNMFPTSRDVFKEKNRDVFKQTMGYVKRLKENNYNLKLSCVLVARGAEETDVEHRAVNPARG